MKQSKTSPLVSILMPVCNGEKFIAEMVISIVNQTYTNYEIIFIDDASTDNSVVTINKTLKNKNITYKIISLSKPHGFSGDAAFNIGLKHCEGKYIAKADQDDRWHDTKLEKQVSFLEKHPEVFLCGTSFRHIDAENHPFYDVLLPTSHKEIAESLLFKANIHTPTILFRNTDSAFFLIRYPKYNDALTFINLIGEGKQFANIGEILFDYRIHSNNYNHFQIKKYFKYYVLAKYAAISEFKYQFRMIDVLRSLLQATFVFIAPEKLIVLLHPAFRKATIEKSR